MEIAGLLPGEGLCPGGLKLTAGLAGRAEIIRNFGVPEVPCCKGITALLLVQTLACERNGLRQVPRVMKGCPNRIDVTIPRLEG